MTQPIDRRRVQRNLRLPPHLTERISAYAAKLGVSDNTAYLLCITAGIDAIEQTGQDIAQYRIEEANRAS